MPVLDHQKSKAWFEMMNVSILSYTLLCIVNITVISHSSYNLLKKMLIPSSVLQWWMLGDQLWKLESRKWVTVGELVYKSIIPFLLQFETRIFMSHCKIRELRQVRTVTAPHRTRQAASTVGNVLNPLKHLSKSLVNI